MEIEEGFQKTDVGIIPNDWDVKPILEITALMTNGFVGTVKSHYTDYDNGILYIQGYNVEENSFNFNGIKRVTHEFHKQHSKSCLQEGDLLTIQTGDIGVTTVVPKELEGANCHALIITRFKKGAADSRFYSYYFNSSEGRKRLKEIETGSTMKHINVGDMIQMLIPYPTKAEQAAIATALNDADALVTQLEKLIAKKRNIKQGAMQKLLKPKEGWVIEPLGKYVKISSGESPSKFEFKDDGIPYFKVEQLNNSEKYVFETPFHISTNLTISKGSIIFPKRGASIFLNKIRILKEDSYMDTNLMTLTVSEELNNEFLFYQLSHIRLDKIADTTSIPQINNKHINPFLIPLPATKNEQMKIIKILSDMEAEIEALEQKLDKYKMVKQGMMQNLLTGRIRLV